jgi:thiamine biosynthesis lipoprotein
MTRLERRAQPWLGTLVSVEVVVDAGVDADAAFASAFSAVARAHRAMSAQDPHSDVARFNRAAQGATVLCDPWTVAVLRFAARVRRMSGGLFDVAFGTARRQAYRTIGSRHVEKLDPSAHIDVGGIAKGYAVDRALAALRRHGIREALVNAGGDLRVIGARAWPIAVRGRDDRPAVVLTLEAGAIATSAFRAGRSPFKRDALIAPGCARVHAIDGSITVAAPTCVFADALTKVVALSGDPAHAAVRAAGGQAWLR